MRPRSIARLVVAVALAAAVVAPAAPPASAAPPANVAPPATAAQGGEYRLDLLAPGDFVTQYTDVTCVGASVQTMLNIIRAGADVSRATQRTAQRTAQQRSNPVYVKRSGGASAMGWAYALGRLGGGPYRVRTFPSRAEALRAVADAIRATGRPAGLLVWRGAHAWVVSGFRATADPATTPRFRVSGLVISDPWWPRQVSSRGRTLPPGTEMTPAELSRHFVLFQRGPQRTGSILNGSFVVVLPVEAAPIATSAARAS
jgi:hypothetical protein